MQWEPICFDRPICNNINREYLTSIFQIFFKYTSKQIDLVVLMRYNNKNPLTTIQLPFTIIYILK